MNAILQDKLGFIWFGTQEGLARYDGYEFRVFKHNAQDSQSIGDNSIWSIISGEDDILWIATNGGLSRFSPKNQVFKNYRSSENNPSSLSDNNVRCLFIDSNGNLWVGTRSGGLNRCSPNQGEALEFVSFQSDPQKANSLSHNDVRALLEDTNRHLWIGTYGGGLNRIDLQKPGKGFEQFRHDPNNPSSLSSDKVLSILQTNSGELWVGTENGLNWFDAEQGHFVRYSEESDSPRTISHNSIWSLTEDRAGTIWAGTNGGGLNLIEKNLRTHTFRHQVGNIHSLCGDDVRALLFDRQGLLWIGTYGNGISKFDATNEYFSFLGHSPQDPTSLSSKTVLSILEDTDKKLWIGTWNGGLNQLDEKLKVENVYKHLKDDSTGISHNTVWAIHEDSRGSLWFGTWGGGLDELTRDERIKSRPTFKHYHHMPNDPESLGNNSILSILECRRGYLWVATWGGGLNQLDLNHLQNNRHHFTKYLKNPKNDSSISDNFIKTIAEDQQGNIWVGTWGGGICVLSNESITNQANRFKRYQNELENPKSLSHNDVMTIFEDQDGMIWVGTYGGGLNKFDPRTQEFKAYTELHGLSNNAVYGILQDENGFLWLSTNNGINRFDPVAESFLHFNQRDGLQGDEFNQGAYFKGTDRRMYFGGINGVSFFWPKQVADNNYLAPVYLTDLLLFHEPVELSSSGPLTESLQTLRTITLNPEDSVFGIKFTALNYRQSEKNHFAYQLEGVDKDWIRTDYRQRQASYRYLNPGTYTFRVKAANDDGHWNPMEKHLEVILLPPWWKTWWAKTLLYVTVIGFLASLYLIRFSIMKRQQYVLEQTVAKRTAELKQANEKLFQLSITDNLTGVNNRSLLGTVFARDFKNSLRYQNDLSCILLDIDHFKAFNDTYGHQAGDFVLKETARILTEMVREGDSICRYGGEEFLIILPNTPIEGGRMLAEKIRQRIESACFNYESNALKVTVSLGVADNKFSNPETESQMIQLADRALYLAKENGRNQVALNTQ